MKISCIIPTKDRRDMVQRAIASVLAQDLPCDEVVVVDDGSGDGTGKEIRSRYPRVRLVRLTGLGPGPARNAGVEAARGDVLMFLDSDDLWLPNHVELLAAALNSGDFQVGYGLTKTVDQVNGGEFFIPGPGEAAAGDCFTALLHWCFLVPSATVVSRQAFTAVGGFPAGGLGEDWHFYLRLAQYFPFGFAGDTPITLRYLHRGSQCCLGGTGAILGALRRIKQTPWTEPHGRAADERFSRLEQWVIEKGETWTTVQEWYSSMKEENMV